MSEKSLVIINDDDGFKAYSMLFEYNGDYMCVGRIHYDWDSITAYGYGSTEDVAEKRMRDAAIERGFKKPFANGLISVYKWSKVKKEYEFKAQYSY